jgi:DNA modification methylase
MTPYYADDLVTIYHGEALEVLATLPDMAYGAVLLDPPYAMIPNAFRGADDGAAGTSGAPVRLLSETLREARRIMADGAIAMLVCDWRRVPDVSYLAVLHGHRIATQLAWVRNNVGLGGLFRSQWDPVLVLSRGTPKALDRSGVPNVIYADVPKIGRTHPYEKPVELWTHGLARIPPTCVVEPYMGTGAGGRAALKSGHRYVGIEIEERYCEIAANRCRQEVLGLSA